MEPLFSIITSTYNSAAHLEGCLQSVAAQNFEAVEHIVVDGGSEDGTVDILRANEQHKANWISEPDEGIYEAWNKGVEMARGEWLLFLGADDRLADKEVLADMARAAGEGRESHPFIYGRVVVVDSATGRVMARHGRPWEELKGSYKGLKPAASSNAGTFFHRSLFEKGHRFDTSYRIAADYKFVLEALRRSEGEPLWVDRLVAVMGGGGASSRPGLRKYREEVRMLRELDLNPPLGRRLYMGFRAYAVTFLHRLLGERMFGSLAAAWRRLRNRNPQQAPRS